MRISKLILSSALLLGGLCQAASAHAETFNVTDGISLQTALNSAQNNDQADTINLAAGPYDASGGQFSYLADATLGSEENFPLTLVGPTSGVAAVDGGGLDQGMSIITENISDDSNATVAVQNITFQNGSSPAGFGGGLFVVTNNADVMVTNCIFQDNDAGFGGGGLYVDTEESGAITVQQSSFFRNTSTAFGGGASISNFIDGDITFDANLLVDNNQSDEAGGAFIGGDDGHVTVTNNIISGNTSLTDSAGGGGLQIVGLFGGSTIVNNTITGNQSGTVGGGLSIFADVTGAVTEIYNNIVFGNTATAEGGDIFVFDNSGDPAGTLIELFNNDLTQIQTDCEVNGGCTLNLSQGANGNFNPLLVDPAGGDFNLGVGSQAIDAGTASAPQLPATDFAGNPRSIGDAPDMGALEALPNIEVDPTSLNFGSVGLGATSSLPLTVTNTGAGDLDILDGVLSDNVNYTLDTTAGANPCDAVNTLQNGESCTAAVIFGPLSTGTLNATLTIESNDPDSPSLVVPITGIGGGNQFRGGGCSLGAGATSISWMGLGLFLLALAAARRLR